MKIIYKSIILMLLFFTFSSCICYANDNVVGNTSLGLPTINDGYRPSVEIDTSNPNGKVIKTITSILSSLTGVGIVAVVIGLALIGFNTILGSASEKAVAQEKYVGLVIAALLIVGGSIIARMIITVAETM